MFQDMLRDTEIYQIIMHEGFEEGIQQGIQQGIRQAEQNGLRDLRQILLTFVQPEFPEVVFFATEQVEKINSTEVLKDLIPKVARSKTAEEVIQLLIKAVNKDKS